ITEPVPHILDVNPALPPAIEAVIEKAMAKNPDDRFSSAGEFYAALSAVADGQSAEEAFKTASTTALRMTAEKTRLAASKTRSAAGKTRIAQPATVQTGKFNIPMPLFIAGGLIGLCLVAVVLMGVLSICPPEGFLPLPPWCAGSTISWPFSAPPTQVAVVLTNTPLPPATEIPVVVIPPTVSATEVPTEVPATPTETPAPVVASSPGGADKVAFISGKEVWLMNIDGSNLKVLTNDQYPKSNLQWIPGTNTLVFISSTNVNTVNADNGEFNTILSFPFAKTVDEFRVSPDAKQVAISLNREMYVVPFDLALLKQAHGKDGLIAMKGCLNYTGSTQAAILLKDFRWSKDSKTAAWLFEGVNASGKSTDTIRVVDISTCNPSKLTLLDEFPGTRFTPDGFGDRPILPDFDWDGGYLFLMNTFDRNSGWGYLYTYTRELHKGTLETPISGTKTRCCYRDARWSPDGSYIFFAYQNKDAAAAPVQFYYIPVSAIRDGSAQTPIPMPDDFFKNPKEAPQPALHSAQP
ncbi:MAG: hypothetical protein NT121_12620, partial [Chloroflexi bacterium]|nr:hypothetical protein [Chloroflexota bacterium]